MLSKRVSKKSSRYADYFEPEEIDCKRKKKDDSDEEEFDDDMVPEPEDLADVLKKKITKQKPKIDCKRKKKDDGDDEEFDDDMDPEPKDLADVLKKKRSLIYLHTCTFVQSFTSQESAASNFAISNFQERS